MAGTAVLLGRRPYDLRHAAVSLWLNSGVPATEVARRAGHGVAVLLKIYAHCIDGQATAANQRIAEALGTQDAEEGPGDEGDGVWSRHPEMAGRGGIRVGAVCIAAPTGPSVAISALVRALVRGRPWAVPPRSVDRSYPEPGAHGRIADGGRPKSRLG